jgi:hypothetical protein
MSSTCSSEVCDTEYCTMPSRPLLDSRFCRVRKRSEALTRLSSVHLRGFSFRKQSAMPYSKWSPRLQKASRTLNMRCSEELRDTRNLRTASNKDMQRSIGTATRGKWQTRHTMQRDSDRRSIGTGAVANIISRSNIKRRRVFVECPRHRSTHRCRSPCWNTCLTSSKVASKNCPSCMACWMRWNHCTRSCRPT